jgi:hypothetical protein
MHRKQKGKAPEKERPPTTTFKGADEVSATAACVAAARRQSSERLFPLESRERAER